MPANLTLIQLVSEQTMQNLLPVLRLKPAKLVHLATPRTVARSALIAEAARQSQCQVQLQTIPLSAMPSMRETHDAVLAAIEDEAAAGRDCILNFTGGTKLMGIGAYVAASKHRVSSLYVDTQDSLFVDGQTGDGLSEVMGNDLSFTPILRALTVHAVARANGCSRITAGRDWRPFLPLAEALLGDPTLERVVHEAVHGKTGLMPGAREPRTPADWLPFFDHEFALPEPVAALSVEAGLLEAGSRPSSCRLPSATRPHLERLTRERVPDFAAQYFVAVAPLQQALSFLTGGWWEVVLARKATDSGRFRDIRWSVQVGERGGADLEEDVIALDGVQVVYISCKRGGHKARLLPLLDEITARARTLGGTFTRRYLAIYETPRGRVLDNLESRARELGIRLLFPGSLSAADPFA